MALLPVDDNLPIFFESKDFQASFGGYVSVIGYIKDQGEQLEFLIEMDQFDGVYYAVNIDFNYFSEGRKKIILMKEIARKWSGIVQTCLVNEYINRTKDES